MGVLAVLFTLWIIYTSIAEITTTSIIILAGYFAVGACFHMYAKHKQKTDPENWAPKVLTAEDVEKEENYVI